MNIQIRSAYTTNKNTADSDRLASVLHTVEAVLDGKPVTTSLWASDPMEAISKASRNPQDLYWKMGQS